jgi:hypothetical protein
VENTPGRVNKDFKKQPARDTKPADPAGAIRHEMTCPARQPVASLPPPATALMLRCSTSCRPQGVEGAGNSRSFRYYAGVGRNRPLNERSAITVAGRPTGQRTPDNVIGAGRPFCRPPRTVPFRAGCLASSTTAVTAIAAPLTGGTPYDRHKNNKHCAVRA